MRADEWEKVKQEQLALYYRPFQPINPTTPPPAEQTPKPNKMTELFADPQIRKPKSTVDL